MKTDLYIKVILTIIAGALLMLVFQNMKIKPIAEAKAYGTTKTIDVNIVSIGGSSVFSAIPVKFTSTPAVKLEVPYGGLNVNVKNYRDFK